MSQHPDPRSIESLLVHADWVRALAGRLVADSARADDLAQDAWVAALDHPPRDARNLKSWLASIMRNRAREQVRADQRRTTREQRVAKPGATVPSSAELVERANLQREIAAHVIALDEPYRTVVLLRWYEGLMPRDIAQRLGRPVDTITTQLARAHEQLRAKLDREHGDRSTWSALLVGIARPEHAAVGVAGVTVGGLLMTTAWKVCTAAVALLLLALVIWRTDRWLQPTAFIRNDTSTASSDSPPAASLQDSPVEVDAHAERSSADSTGGATTAVEPTPSRLTWIEAHGRVVDERGTPMPGFRIRAIESSMPHVEAKGLFQAYGHLLMDAQELALVRANPVDSAAFLRAHDEPGFREALAGDDLHVEAITDGEGRYALSVRGVPAGRVEIESVDPAWVVFLSAYEKPSKDVVQIVAPAVTLAGVLVDTDGAPVEHATLSMWKYVQDLREMPLDLDTRETSSVNADMLDGARFRLEKVPHVLGCKLVAFCPGWQTTRVLVPSMSNTAMRIVMTRAHPTPKISGIVLDVDGKPAPDATVVFGNETTRSGAGGRFVLATHDWRPDSDLVVAKSGSIATMIPEFGRRIGAQTDDIAGIVLHLAGAPLSITGRVLTADGAPCVNWDVDLDDATPAGGYVRSAEAIAAGRGDRATSLRTDAAGAFQVGGLDARAYRLHALPPDGSLLVKAGPFAAGSKDVEVRIPADAVRPLVTGRVITKHGDPVVDATISVHGVMDKNKEGWTESLRGHVARTDRLGRFELRDAPRFDVSLDVYTEWSARKTIVLAPEDRGEDLEVVVSRLARFHVELEPSDPADAFEVLDGEGAKLTVHTHGIDDKERSTRVPRDEAGFVACDVDDEAKMLVLLRDGAELRRVPITLDATKRNVIRP